MQVWDIDEKLLLETLRVLRRAALQGPTLLHCDYGTERTGLITALYRMAYQGWSKEAALAEMEQVILDSMTFGPPSLRTSAHRCAGAQHAVALH